LKELYEEFCVQRLQLHCFRMKDTSKLFLLATNGVNRSGGRLCASKYCNYACTNYSCVGASF